MDLAILGPSPYIEAQQKSNALELLARVVFRENAIEQVVLITSPESPITDIASLRGRSFVFGDRMSFGSHFLPRWLLEEHNIHMNDLRSHAFLGNQDNVLLSVVHRDFDAAGVRLDIVQKFAGRPLRIFHGPVAIPPHVVVCRGGLDQAIRERIRTALFELRDEGVLRAISPDMRGFSPVDDEQFDFARAIMRSFQKGRTP